MSTIQQTTRERKSSKSIGQILAENFTFSTNQIPLLLLFGLSLLIVVLGCTGIVSPTLAFGGLVGAAIAAAALFNPVFALLLVCLGAGLPSLLVPVPGHTMRPIEAALFLCVAVVFVHRPSLRMRAPHVLLLLFFAVAIISFLHVPQIGDINSYGANKRLYGVLLFVIAFFVGTFLAGRIKNSTAFLSLALLSNIPTLLIGLGQALKLHMPALLVPSQAIEVTQEGRLSGPSDSPTTFAYYMLVVLAVALACWVLGERKRDRYIGFSIAAASALELLLSGTRMASAAGLILIIIALVVTKRYKVLFATFTIASIGVIFTFNTLLPKFLHGEASDSNRFFLWDKALHLIAEQPWLGIGMSQFPNYYNTYIVSLSDKLDPTGISVHNQYLEWAMESGVFWLLFGVLLMLSLLGVCLKAFSGQREQRALYLATILMTLGLLGICFTDVPFDKPEVITWFFLIAGVAVGSATQTSQLVTKVRQGALATASSFYRSSRGIEDSFSEPVSKQDDGVAAGVPKLAHVPRMADTGKMTLRIPTPYMRAVKSVQVQSARGYIPPPPRLPSYDISRELTGTLPVIDVTSEAAPSARKTGYSIIIRLISWVVAIPIIFPTTAMLTRYFGPVRYGEYNFVLTIMAICALFSLTGMDPLISRYLSRQKREQWSETLSDALSTRIITGVSIAAIAAIITCLLPIDSEQRNLLLLGYGTLLFSYSFNCVRCIYEIAYGAEQRVGATSLLTTCNRVTTAGLIALAVFSHLPFLWTYGLIAYSDLPYFIILAFLATRRYDIRFRLRFKNIRKVMLESLVFTGHDALDLVAGQMDVLLLLPLAGSLSVGIYALALRITNPLLNIVYIYVTGLFPYLSKKFEEGFKPFSDLYYEATRILALGIIPLAFFVVMTASQIVALIGGSDFTNAVMPTRLLMISVALGFFTQLAVRTCMAANKERTIPVVTATSLVVNIAANIILISFWQATGAGIAAVTSEIVSVCLFSLLLVRNVQLWRILRILLQIVLGSLPGAVFLFWQQEWSLFLLTPIFFILTLLGCLLTGAISLKDMRIVGQNLLARAGKIAK